MSRTEEITTKNTLNILNRNGWQLSDENDDDDTVIPDNPDLGDDEDDDLDLDEKSFDEE